MNGFELRAPHELDARVGEIARSGTRAVIAISDGVLYAERRRLATLAMQHRLAVIASFRDYADAGVLLSYGSDIQELIRRGAALADRILNGAKPANLPFEQPTKFQLVINGKTAKALHLTIPGALLARADQLIE